MVNDNSMKFFATIIVFVLLTTSTLAQEEDTIIYKIKKDDCIFRCSISDKIYSQSDTIKILYTVKNIRSNSVTIFDPYRSYWRARPFSRSVSLGGNWFTKLGYINEPLLFHLSPDSTYQHTFYFILQKGKGSTELDSLLFKQRSSLRADYYYDVIYFDIAFYVEEDPIHYKKIEPEHRLTFRSEADAFEFEAKSKRFILGPILLRFDTNLAYKPRVQ